MAIDGTATRRWLWVLTLAGFLVFLGGLAAGPAPLWIGVGWTVGIIGLVLLAGLNWLQPRDGRSKE